jgi:hypothetical protein
MPAGVTTFPPFTIVSNLTARKELGAGSFPLVAGGFAVLCGLVVLCGFAVFFVAINP